MSTDLFLTTYRQQERELGRRLEHARVARERAATAEPGARGAATPAATTAGWLGALAATVRARVARALHAARDGSPTTGCCSPA